jgi:hypothetical protein
MFMSERSLAIFLHQLLAGELAPVGPVNDGATLKRLVEAPPSALQTLLGAHLDALLAGWPSGSTLRPPSLPTAMFWIAAALNNAAWAIQRPDPRLLTITLRLSEAIPVAADPGEALAYHSLIRHLARFPLAEDWRPVAQRLFDRSPLTTGWLPRCNGALSPVLIELLASYPVQADLRDRWLTLLPDEQSVRRTIPAATAAANAELGQLLRDLLALDTDWRPFLLAFYEADCEFQRRGSDERPTWPLLDALGAAARQERDVVRRRYAQKTLYRYAPLVDLMADEACVRPYRYLDGRFLTQVADAVPHRQLKLWRMVDRRTVETPIADSR